MLIKTMIKLNFQFLSSRINSIEWRTKAFIRTLSFLALASIFLYWFLVMGFQSLENKKIAEREVKIDPFALIEVEAKSVFVWDVVNHRPLFEKNADTSRPLASLTKVMTAITANHLAPNLESITIKLADLSPEGDSYLRVASSWNVKNLIDYVLLVSSNDGAHALAASVGASSINTLEQNANADITREIFIEEMNKLALQIGLTNSTFMNEHGLDTGESVGGAYGSARDMALLFEHALTNYPHLLEATRYKRLSINDLSDHTYPALNTNDVINMIPSPLASKTGYTELAGGNLVVAFDAGLGRPIIISILASSEKGRFTDIMTLVNTTMKYLEEE